MKLKLKSILAFIIIIFSSNRLRTEKWMNVQVGDIIKLENNQFVTVIMLTFVHSYTHSFTHSYFGATHRFHYLFLIPCLLCPTQADLLLLSSSEPLNLIYIETAELDGSETVHYT